MRFRFAAIGIVSLIGIAFLSADGQEEHPDPTIVRLRDKLNPEYVSWSPAHAIERAAEHLATINEYDRVRIRYFDLSDLPRTLLPAGISSLLFGSNSAARIPVTYRPRPVPNTDNRLFWIDLCWFNWSPEAWEEIAQEDYVFREPLIPSNSRGLNYLREQTNANAIVRADWFMWYVFDNGEFINTPGNEDFNQNAFYYKLVYANVEFEREVNENGKKVKKKVKRVGPETTAEFEQAWFVDFNPLKQFPIDKGAMVDTSHSNVALNNRVLWRVQSSVGKYWRTFDVFRTAGDQDFIENPFPKEFDAGEHIFQDERGAQFYLLSDGKGKSIDYANPFVVKGDPVSNPHNTALVTSRSCIHCHDNGILRFKNEHEKNVEAGLKFKAISPARAERFNQFFLQSRRMERYIAADQDNYAEFIKDCNGLTPAENLQNFIKLRAWYGKPVTLEQAAREHGCDQQELADALGYTGTKGRLGRLALDGTPIPRATWERGSYAESGLLLLEWRKRGKMKEGKEAKP